MSQPLKIFIIYARKDAEFKDELIYHLKPLQLLGLVDTWHDGDILPGETWDAEIKNQLHRADVVIPLISTHFINSDYIQGTEFKEARQRWERGEAEITPVVVRDCLWEELASLADLQALPSNGQKILPVTRWADRDEAWTVIANGLKRLCVEVQKRKAKTETVSQEKPKTGLPTAHKSPIRESQPSLWKRYRYGVLGAAGVLVLLLAILLNKKEETPSTTSPNILEKQSVAQIIEPEMVKIPGGSFQMGSNDGQDDEKPVHSVTVGDFYLGKTEVTVAQFKAFVDATGYRTEAEKEGWSYVWSVTSWDKKNGVTWRDDAQGNRHPESEYNHPVIHVSWNDAKAYCDWLSEKTGKKYRLPTEAEWEYAAGNGAKHHKYSWGDGNPVGKKGGNVADESLKKKFPDLPIFGDYDDGYVFTAPVASFDANGFGLYDMSGNVWEWCSDWYAEDYFKNSPSSNPQGPSSGDYRVCRSGSWGAYPVYDRVAYRLRYSPYDRDDVIGFRAARG